MTPHCWPGCWFSATTTSRIITNASGPTTSATIEASGPPPARSTRSWRTLHVLQDQPGASQHQRGGGDVRRARDGDDQGVQGVLGHAENQRGVLLSHGLRAALLFAPAPRDQRPDPSVRFVCNHWTLSVLCGHVHHPRRALIYSSLQVTTEPLQDVEVAVRGRSYRRVLEAQWVEHLSHSVDVLPQSALRCVGVRHVVHKIIQHRAGITKNDRNFMHYLPSVFMYNITTLILSRYYTSTLPSPASTHAARDQ